jgi:hypothetical protein
MSVECTQIQVSSFGFQVSEESFEVKMKVIWMLKIWKSIKLCRLHIEICDLSHSWPSEEK